MYNANATTVTPFTQTAAAPSVSAKYNFFSTAEIIDRATSAGFVVASQKIARVRNPDNRPYAKHIVRMRTAGARPKVGDVFSEVVLTNDHQGRNALSLSAGLFRLACSNGLAIPTALCEGVKIRHVGHTIGDVIEGVYSIVERSRDVDRLVVEMQRTELNDSARFEFASRALALRTDKEPAALERLLMPTRSADVGRDLWRTYNVIQERIVAGGVPVITEARGRPTVRSLRAIRGASKDLDFNRELFALAAEYVH